MRKRRLSADNGQGAGFAEKGRVGGVHGFKMAAIGKAVITAAGNLQKNIPMQTLVDRNGETKSVLQIILDEVFQAGVADVALVVRPGTQKAHQEAAGAAGKRLFFIEQPAPEGYAHAVYCAKDFVKNDPFLHLVDDHLYVSRGGPSCVEQLMQAAESESCSISAVQTTSEHCLRYYGAIGGRRLPQQKNLYQINDVIEKPTPTEAEQRLIIPGLRRGSYLCFFGMHAFSPTVMERLCHRFESSQEKPPRFMSDIILELSRCEKYLACELAGNRFEIASKYGLFQAQLALALEGGERSQVLSLLLDQLAAHQLQTSQ